jgi:hypothetical protein
MMIGLAIMSTIKRIQRLRALSIEKTDQNKNPDGIRKGLSLTGLFFAFFNQFYYYSSQIRSAYARERLRLPLEGKLSAKRTDEVECSNHSNY